MIQKRTVVLLVIALLFGGLAALVAFQRVQQPVTGNADVKPVLVAAIDIAYGTKLEADMIRQVAWPASSLPDGIYSDPALAIGRIANADIAKGEPITARRAVETLTGNSLASLIAPNMRALTVRVNDVIGVAGFLLPGNRVDVLATPDTRGQGRAQTRTLLENLKVLAVDQQARADKDDPVVVRAVTLEVDPQQAEVVVQATMEGSVQMVLRNPLDQESGAAVTAPEPPPAVPAARPAARKATRPRAPEAEAAPKSLSVTVIRGVAAEDNSVSSDN